MVDYLVFLGACVFGLVLARAGYRVVVRTLAVLEDPPGDEWHG